MISHKKVIFKKFPSLHQKTGLSQTKNAGKNNSFAFWKLFQMLSLSWKVWGLYLDDVLGVSLWITHSTILKLGQPNPTTAEPWSTKMSWFFFSIKGWFIIQNTTSLPQSTSRNWKVWQVKYCSCNPKIYSCWNGDTWFQIHCSNQTSISPDIHL